MDSSQSGGPNGRPQGQGGGRPDGAPRRNRNRNRNRNRGDRERGERDSFENKGQRSGKGGGGGNRGDRKHDDREFRPRGPKQPPKPTLGQRILSILTFGLLGKPKPAPARRTPETWDRPDRDRPASAEGPRREERPPRNRDREDRPPRNRDRDDRPPREPRPDREERPARAPKPPVSVEVTSPRLYVGNLDYEAQEQDLEDLFRGVGTVASAEIVTNPRTQQSKGFAFVEMSHIEEARRAVEVLHDKDFMGRKLLVTGAKSEGPRDDEDEEGNPSPSGSGEEPAAA